MLAHFTFEEQTGDWTFGVNSDDGFSLLFPEQSFDTATNGELVPFLDGNMLRYPGNRPAQDSLATIRLSGGDHPFCDPRTCM